MLKKAQEEMVGFALIMIVVAVILLFFMGIWLKNSGKESVESYEIDSFIQAFLHYTTDCVEDYEPNYYSIKDLIIACNNKEKCSSGIETCEVLDLLLKEIIKESWKVGDDLPIKGYGLKIDSKDKLIIDLNKGNVTNNYKNSVQKLGKENLRIILNIYY